MLYRVIVERKSSYITKAETPLSALENCVGTEVKKISVLICDQNQQW